MQSHRRLAAALLGVVLLASAACTRDVMQARLHLLAERPDAAIADLNRHLAEHPEDAGHRRTLARLYLQTGQPLAAERELATLRRQSPQDAWSAIYLGIACLDQNRLPAAVAAWETVAGGEFRQAEARIDHHLAVLRSLIADGYPAGGDDDRQCLVTAARQEVARAVRMTDAQLQHGEGSDRSGGDTEAEGASGGG